MATLPSIASLTGASTTNAQQKTNFTNLQTFLSDLLGTDSSNKVAARTALGVGLQASNVTILAGATTLTAANIGQTIVGGGASAFTALLPQASAVPTGARIEFINANAGVMTVTRQGTDVINAGATRFSMAVPLGENLVLESNGSSTWYAVGGSVQLQYGSLFAASLTSSPWAQHPSGIITQAGAAVCDASGNAVITFPKAFTTAPIVVATPLVGTAFTYAMNIASRSATGFSAIGTLGNSGVNSLNFAWMAFGY